MGGDVRGKFSLHCYFSTGSLAILRIFSNMICPLCHNIIVIDIHIVIVTVLVHTFPNVSDPS